MITALDGVATCCWAHILRQLQLIPSHKARWALAEGTQALAIRGPNGVHLAVTASKATGLLVHFDRETTTDLSARDEILRQLSGSIQVTCKAIPSWFTACPSRKTARSIARACRGGTDSSRLFAVSPEGRMSCAPSISVRSSSWARSVKPACRFH